MRFHRNIGEEIHHMLGLARETLAQFRILRRDTDWAGVQMTLPHHDAAFGNESCRRETEFIGPQQGADYHVTSCPQATVDLHGDPAP